MSLSAAKSRVMFAEDNLSAGRYDDALLLLDAATAFLEEIPRTAETAGVWAQIAALRKAVQDMPSAEDERLISAAHREVATARGELAAGNLTVSSLEAVIERAEGYVRAVPEIHRADLVVAIAALRAQLADGRPAQAVQAAPAADPVRVDVDVETEAQPEDGDHDELRRELEAADLAERTRRIDEQLLRHFGEAENVKTWRPQDSATSIDFLASLLEAEETARVLPADTLARHRARLAAAVANRVKVFKDEALSRALPFLTDLEQRLETDPLAGLSQADADAVASGLDDLRQGVLREIWPVDIADADAIAVNERLAVCAQKLDDALASLRRVMLGAEVGDAWAMVEQTIAGWEAETRQAGGRLLDAPNTPLTQLAMASVRHLLDDPRTAAIRAENVGDPVVEAIYREAEEVLANASEKLAAAYRQVLDEADEAPLPMRRDELDRPVHLARAIENAFVGTEHLTPLLARATGLGERWTAEFAAIMRARQDLYDTLSAEADAAWPAIVAATGARSDIDPTDGAALGETVLLSGRNRSGWDFGGCDFAMRVNGVPVGGGYEPHVLGALEHAWYELKLDVNDRIPWDVVAVVEGPGKIGLRTTVVLRDSGTGLEIGKKEEWPPVDCVRLRIIALHAGPVAIGPAS